MKRIIYLTCIERIFFGVLRSQVIKTLETVKISSQGMDIWLVSFIPVHHYFRYSERRKCLKNEYKRIGMKFVCLPIVFSTGEMYIRHWLLPFFLVQTVPILFFLVLFFRARIIHGRSYPATLVGLILKKLVHCRLIFDMRGIYVDEGLLLGKFKSGSQNEKLWRKIEIQLLEKADVVIGVSPGFRDLLHSRLDDTKFTVIPCSVDPSEFFFSKTRYLDERRNKGLSERFVIVFSGSLGVDQKMMVLGFRADVPEILNILDIFVLSSLWEGLGRSLTEAMYMGCPVIATNVEGVPELVRDGDTGILVPPKDSAAIARSIIYLMNNPNEAQRMGDAARKKVKNDFSAEKMIKRIERLYQNSLKSKFSC